MGVNGVTIPRPWLAALLCGGCLSRPVKDAAVESGAPETGDSPAVDSTDTTGGETGHTAETGHTGETARPDSGSETGETGDTGASGPDTPVWAEPCAAYRAPEKVGVVADTDLDELSGVAVSRRYPDVLWVHEDHAGAPEIYALDTLGETLATVTLDGATNNDWEDIAVGPCGDDWCIFLAEVGNNDLDRTELGVYALVEPDLDTLVDGELETADWVWYGMSYPDEPQNAEALAIDASGMPVILTKRYDDEQSRVYIYPWLDPAADTTLVSLGTVLTGTDGMEGGAALTGADLWPDDSRLIFRTYGGVGEIDLSDGLGLIASAPVTTTLGSPEPHGEAVAYDPWAGGYWQVSEGLNPGLWYSGCAP